MKKNNGKFAVRKFNFSVAIFTFVSFAVCILFSANLSAYTINGTVVTLDPADCSPDNTNLIQVLLSQTTPVTYTKIIIPPGPSNSSWPVKPLFFTHGNMEIHLNANAVLEALTPGGYPNGTDCMLKATSLSNIQVTGDAGSEILMHKEEYANLAAAEWRHALNFLSCSNVTVSGLTLKNTGGDGIYLGDVSGGTVYCSGVTITNVVTDGAARNGISVISVNGLTMTGCTFKNTKGQGNAAAGGPWAGIDLEPNTSSEWLAGIEIDNCTFFNNAGCGFTQSTSRFGRTLNINVNNCTMQGNGKAYTDANKDSIGGYGIWVKVVPEACVGSTESFQNCNAMDNYVSGVWVESKAEAAGTLTFTDCYLRNNNLAVSNTAFEIHNYSGTTSGNIVLSNVVIEQPANGTDHALCINGAVTDGVSGTIYASSGDISISNATNINVTLNSNAAQAYWKMDETSGNSASDANGGHTGTLQNNPAWVTGQIGGGLAFASGANQSVLVANDSALNIGTGDFSISLWMQRADDSLGIYDRLLCKGASADTDTGYALLGSNGSVGLILCNGSTRMTTSSSIPGLGQWHHFAFTVDRANKKVAAYLDGICQTQQALPDSYSGVDISNTLGLVIGSTVGGSLFWPGKVDDLRIYKRMLMPGEIANIASGASANWRFDEGNGSTAADSTGRANGTLQNNPTWTSGVIGEALALNGANQFVHVTANSSDLNIGSGNFSIALWMQRTNTGITNSRLLYKGASADTDPGYALFGSDSSISLILCDGSSRITAGSAIPNPGEWHHYAFTVDRTNKKLYAYLDGVFQQQKDIPVSYGADISSAVDLLIGAASTGGYLCWPGQVDDLRIYKRALSADEIMRLYIAAP